MKRKKPINLLLLLVPVICLCILSLLPITAYAHSGRTDAQGGHYNRSTGEYHFHHGQSAHDHYDMDGDGDLDCPYDFEDKTSSNSSSSSGGSSNTSQANTKPEDSSSPSIGGKIAISLFVLFPVSFLPTGLLLWLVHFILGRFKIELSEKADAVLFWILYAAVNISFIYLIVLW